MSAPIVAVFALSLAAPGCATNPHAHAAAGPRPMIANHAEPADTEAPEVETTTLAATNQAIGTPGTDVSSPQDSTSPADAKSHVTLTTPVMVGPLTANPDPMSFEAGDWGSIYVSGAVTALGLVQDNVAPGDDEWVGDISNAQVFVQKPEGVFQFFAQAGAYSIPSLGTAYIRASDAVDDFYGVLPTAFVKIAPDDEFSIMAGKLATLFGAEYTFTFENMNIERGLLWNQENAINRGVQANYTHGPLAMSLSLNDGFYSEQYSWLTAAATYTFDSDSLCLYAGGNLSDDDKSTLATPLAQNNSQIYGLIYSHSAGPWTLSPYVQYTDVPSNSSVGIADDASTYGAAFLVRYAFDSHFSLACRAEYIDSSGSSASPSLIYGPGSNAWSFTATPTYQTGPFYVRAELSYVGANDTTDGFALGPNLDENSQVRLMLEMGVLF